MIFQFIIHFNLSARSLKKFVPTILWQAWTSKIYFPIFIWVKLSIFGLNYFLEEIQSKSRSKGPKKAQFLESWVIFHFYIQIDGVAMSSLLEYTNTLIYHFEKQWLLECGLDILPKCFQYFTPDTKVVRFYNKFQKKIITWSCLTGCTKNLMNLKYIITIIFITIFNK